MKNGFYLFFALLLAIGSTVIASSEPVLLIDLEDNHKADIILKNCTEEIIGFSILLDIGQECDSFNTTSDEFLVLSAQVGDSNKIIVKGITAFDLKGESLKLFSISSMCELSKLKIISATIYGHEKEWLIKNGVTETVAKETQPGDSETRPSSTFTDTPVPTATPTPSSSYTPSSTPVAKETQPGDSETRPSSQRNIPGFEGFFAITGLLIAVYFLLRRNKS